ncbi:MAG: gliding motility-associated C-terminal domain-containing protein [Bacteroidetes bacterium]|nr:gliding motility-associated C-terminal domain-containing protein [Bacteroidota bacterium]MBS1540507.1 gliding motility-associated C-terminal domain-containing protein [Bacteroidota bacterium]
MNHSNPTLLSFAEYKKPVLFFLIGLGFLFSSVKSSAQYTKLFDFGSTSNGMNPYSAPISDGTFLYGTTRNGGANNLGTIYKVKTDGTGFTKLLDFNGVNGSNPIGALFYDGTFLYGTTYSGGANSSGVIFKLKPDGSGYTKLFDFNYLVTGGYSYSSLISDGTYLYGTTSQGGSKSYGTVFKIKTDGTGFSTLLEFDGTTNGGLPYGSLYSDGTFLYGTTTGQYFSFGSIFKVKTDGTSASIIYQFTGTNTNPYGALISDGTFLYGMTNGIGSSYQYGTLFKIMPDGTSFSVIVNFNNSSPGATPTGSLVYDGTYLYGTTTEYGANSRGTIFKVKTDGSGLTKILDNDIGTYGQNPEGTLLLSGSVLYGVKSGGGAGVPPFYPGTVFKINTDGSSYTKLFFFDTEGGSPYGSLYSDGTFLYGMTNKGGIYNDGTVFKIKADGTGFQRLYDFDGTNSSSGASPYGTFISDGTFLYGMTNGGGVNSSGIIFKIKPDGTSFTKLLDFDNTNTGGNPHGSLYSDGTFLYGMTPYGGINSAGTIVKIKPDGSGYTKLFDFSSSSGGYNPNGSLISDGTFLYGTTYYGGTNGYGTYFKIKPDGSGYATIIDLDSNTSGIYPNGDLTSDGTYLYGMQSGGGVNGYGTIVKVKPDGTGFAKLLDFNNYIGANPYGSLVLNGTYLYGMCQNGGLNSLGTTFRIKTDGTGFSKMLDLSDGSYPQGSLISDGSFLYGMTANGGANGYGTLFKTTLTPFVSISNIVPADGVVGTYVTINGVSIDPTPANNIVKFNGVSAHVVSATNTSLVAIVPAGATTGSISITAGTTGTSTSAFTVDTVAVMVDVTVQNCHVNFLPPTYDYIQPRNYQATETFIPANPTDKVKISFSSINLSGDALYVYDGPTASSPLLATLNNNNTPLNIVATGSGGELTFVYKWGDGTTDWQATITCVASGPPPVITTQALATQIGGKITLDLKPLIATANLDLTSLQVVTPPTSGATASIDANGILTIDYHGMSFAGTEQITIRACDINGQCATQDFSLEVAGDIVVYNGVSPNGANPKFVIQYIEILPDTKNNSVYIFDRWQNQVWHGSNYDNTSIVFKGISDSGGDLPSGVYFYRIDFAGNRKSKTGFISLRR